MPYFFVRFVSVVSDLSRIQLSVFALRCAFVAS
nr:MAG TPA: hypothetical protein [Caudoviricetes sp.]